MAKNFANQLSDLIQSHQEFWNDLVSIQIAGVRASLSKDDNNSNEEAAVIRENLISRLVYSASVFSQTSSEKNKALAQLIALSTLISTSDDNIRERITNILASIGNFPSVRYLRENFSTNSSSFLGELQVRLLQSLNSVQIGEVNLPLTDFQLQVWKDLPGTSATSISAPTSAGKSFLVIEYLCQKIIKDENSIAIYVAPTRALLAEVHRKISARLINYPEIRVSTVPSLDAEGRSKQIFVLTQERLHVLLSIAELNVNIVIVDEAQNLADGTRGMILQDCLERLRQNNETAQVILLSPGAEGFLEVGRLLGLNNILIKETSLSPVLQNRIIVKAVDGNPKEFILELLNQTEISEICRVTTQRGVANPTTRLAVAVLELGGKGASLVYATGPVKAEEIASQLTADMAIVESHELRDLSRFIKTHIHPEYGLASMVQHGVAFHYGRMPTLLREALENAFRSGAIQYLVCTTTLFQGVNLPARNVFINTPTRGRGISLDAAYLWNFAGRAGRLGQDLVGNVFLVDYHQWKEKELNQPVKFKVSPAFSEIVANHFDKVIGAVSGDMPKLNMRDSLPGNIRAAAGLLLARASSNGTSILLERNIGLTSDQRDKLERTARDAATAIRLPTMVLKNNWTVDPYGLRRLADRMRTKIEEGNVDELIPIHPDEGGAHIRYAGIFSRLVREVLNYKVKGYGGFIATYAIPWMSGAPYPVLIGKWINYQKKKNPNADVNDTVRKAFDFMEDVLRFQMVQLGKAYIDVLRHVFAESGLGHRSIEIYDYSLTLELGVSSTSGRAFIELGTSRITALALEALFPDSELTPTQARSHLLKLNLHAISLSRVIVSELHQLGLISDSQLPDQMQSLQFD